MEKAIKTINISQPVKQMCTDKKAHLFEYASREDKCGIFIFCKRCGLIKYVSP